MISLVTNICFTLGDCLRSDTHDFGAGHHQVGHHLLHQHHYLSGVQWVSAGGGLRHLLHHVQGRTEVFAATREKGGRKEWWGLIMSTYV